VLIGDHALLGFFDISQKPTGDCLVVAHLVCGLVAFTGWLCCSRSDSELVGALERLLQGWWIRLGFPVDTQGIVARAYGFPVGLENPAGAVLRPFGSVAWRGGVAALLGWLVCSSGWAAFPGGPVGTVKFFTKPHSVGMSDCLVGAMW